MAILKMHIIPLERRLDVTEDILTVTPRGGLFIAQTDEFQWRAMTWKDAAMPVLAQKMFQLFGNDWIDYVTRLDNRSR